MGLALARKQKAWFDAASLGMRGGPFVTVYVSREGHASIEKSMALLGMGREQLRKIAILDDSTIDVEALQKQVVVDRNNGYLLICVVANAGTTNTGAVDPECNCRVLPRAGYVAAYRCSLWRTRGGDRGCREAFPRARSRRFGHGQSAQVVVPAGGSCV